MTARPVSLRRKSRLQQHPFRLRGLLSGRDAPGPGGAGAAWAAVIAGSISLTPGTELLKSQAPMHQNRARTLKILPSEERLPGAGRAKYIEDQSLGEQKTGPSKGPAFHSRP